MGARSMSCGELPLARQVQQCWSQLTCLIRKYGNLGLSGDANEQEKTDEACSGKEAALRKLKWNYSRSLTDGLPTYPLKMGIVSTM